MFKRVVRRQKKREEEEELGLNDEVKDLYGLQDTDSDESESDSDSSAGSEDLSADLPDLEEEASGDEEEDDEDMEDSLHKEDESEHGETIGNTLAPTTIADALENPFYSAGDGIRSMGCIICPGKILHGSQPMEGHLQSVAHKRRHEKFLKITKDVDPSSDPKEYVEAISKGQVGQTTQPSASADSPTKSKRSLKKEKRTERFRAKRVKIAQLKREQTTKEKSEPKSDLAKDSSKTSAPKRQNKAEDKPLQRSKKKQTDDLVDEPRAKRVKFASSTAGKTKLPPQKKTPTKKTDSWKVKSSFSRSQDVKPKRREKLKTKPKPLKKTP